MSLKEIKRLLKEQPGYLQFITNIDAENGRSPKDPLSLIYHTVTKVDSKEDSGGRISAYTDEGDMCYGEPKDVLARLSEVAVALGKENG